MKLTLTILTAASVAVSTAAAQAPAPNLDYRLGIVSESGDIVTWLKPGLNSLAVDHVVAVGIMPADIDGPHNITVSPDRQFYYVSIAHGTPYGSLWKLAVRGDTLAGRAPLEMFPTTISLTPDGELAFVANSDFYGDHPRTNVVSVVHTPSMTTVSNIAACDMPHGVKVNHAGSMVYISCMHSDELLELDVGDLRITRRAPTGTGHAPAVGNEHAAHQAAGTAGSSTAAAPASTGHECAPTFVSVSPDDKTLYVACNYGNSVQVWDAASMTMTREIPVGTGAYNIEPSPDGNLVIVTNKKAQSVSLIDARTLAELARIPTSKKIVHGVAFSPDGQYAFISAESIGADPGSVDMIDLAARRIVATIAVPGQPTGITVLRQ